MKKRNLSFYKNVDLKKYILLYPCINSQVSNKLPRKPDVKMFYLNSTLNFRIPLVFVFQLEVYFRVDRLLTGLTAQQKGTTARWYSNKISLSISTFFIFWPIKLTYWRPRSIQRIDAESVKTIWTQEIQYIQLHACCQTLRHFWYGESFYLWLE